MVDCRFYLCCFLLFCFFVLFFGFSLFLFFCILCFFICFFLFSLFSVVRADAKIEKQKNVAMFLLKKCRFLWKKDSWPSVDTGAGRSRMANLMRVAPLSCFSFSIFLGNIFCSFIFSCIFLQYVPLLALVSECNYRCFLRSRCSMEMWCLDDTGRCDWVGPPTRERA